MGPAAQVPPLISLFRAFGDLLIGYIREQRRDDGLASENDLRANACIQVCGDLVFCAVTLFHQHVQDDDDPTAFQKRLDQMIDQVTRDAFEHTWQARPDVHAIVEPRNWILGPRLPDGFAGMAMRQPDEDASTLLKRFVRCYGAMVNQSYKDPRTAEIADATTDQPLDEDDKHAASMLLAILHTTFTVLTWCFENIELVQPGHDEAETREEFLSGMKQHVETVVSSKMYRIDNKTS